MAGRAAAFGRVMAGVNDWQVDALGGYFAYLRLPEGAPDAMAAAFMERGQGGWDSDLAYLFTSHASITSEQLKTRPFFDEFAASLGVPVANSCPWLMANTRSDTLDTRPMSCSTMSTEMPSSC